MYRKIDRKMFPLHRPCVEWDRARHSYGYGLKWFEGKMWRVHRLAYFLITGETPEVVQHRCDNPACYEFSHLQAGTHATNSADKVSKGRHRNHGGMLGEKHPKARLTEQDVRDIREDPRSHRTIAKDYGIDHSLVGYIKRRKRWSHVE